MYLFRIGRKNQAVYSVMRTEKDFLGEKEIPSDALWGIHSARAVENFNISGYKIPRELISAYGYVKLACALTAKELGKIDTIKADAIIKACHQLIDGEIDNHIVVDSMAGGAGTSLNMNVNEVIANCALELLGKEKGDYSYINPIDDVNKFQSTNDTFPTAVKVACLNLLKELESSITALQMSLEQKEKEFADIIKVGRTQLMDAVLTTLGKEFSAYAEAIARDRWRIYKCAERLRVINLGGTAIGTGLNAPRQFIFKVNTKLRELTGLPLARAENMIENTQNCDVFAEVSGILKAHACNLIKISNDLRLMSSQSFGEISLPPVQAGSSIMPFKVNPVIPETVGLVGMKVLGNDTIINQCVATGQLELNHAMPLIAHSMIESLKILTNANKIFKEKCIDGLQANKEGIQKHLDNSFAVLTVLAQKIGYDKACEIAKIVTKDGKNLKDYILKNNILSEEEFEALTTPEAILGFGE